MPWLYSFIPISINPTKNLSNAWNYFKETADERTRETEDK